MAKQFPFPSEPLKEPPHGCPLDDLSDWVHCHELYKDQFSASDFKIYDRVRRRKNNRIARQKKMSTEEGKKHLAQLSKVGYIFFATYK